MHSHGPCSVLPSVFSLAVRWAICWTESCMGPSWIFLDVGWWPIFNLADSSIVVGMAILVGVLVFFEKDSDREKPLEGTPSPRGNEGDG